MTAIIQNRVKLQLLWIAASSRLSDRSFQGEPADLLSNYIEHGERLAAQLSGDQQEQHLFRMLSGLIDGATDPLAPDTLKQLCLDNLYRPSGRLRTLYQNNPQGLRKLNRIHHSITILYNQCSRRC